MASNELSVMLTAKGNLETELRGARDRVKDLSSEIRKITAAGGTVGDDLANEFRQAQKAAADLGEEVNRTNKRIKDSSTQSTTAMGKLGGAIVKHQNAIRNAGLVAGGALAILVKQSVSAASDLQESMSKIDAVFGSSAKEIVAWSEDSASAMVMSQQQALEAAGTYGNLFSAFGLNKGDAADMSKTLVQLAADLASFNNTSVDEALTAIQSGISGETEPLKRYGAVLSDVRLKEEALALGIISSTKDALDPAVKAQAAYSLILKDTALAQGDVERTADGLANTQKRASAEFENAKAALGTDLLPVVTEITKAFANFAGFMGSLPSPVRNVALAVAAISAAAMIATPRIISMIAAMKTAGITAGGMATKVKSASALLMGPWGIALAAGGFALGHFAEQAAKAEANVDTFRQSIDTASGAIIQSGLATITQDLLTNISSEDWDMMKKFGINVQDVTAAVAAGGKQWEDYEGKLNRIVMGKESGSGQVQILADNARNLADQVAQGKEAWRIAGDAAKIAGVKIDDAGNFIADTGDAIETTGDQAEDAAKKISPLTRAINGLNRAVARQKALADFKKAIKESVTKPSKDAAYQVIDDFDAAFNTFKNGGAAQAEFVIANYDSVETAIAKSGLSKKLRQQLLKPLQEAKLEAEKVLTAVNNIDGASVTAKVTYSGGTPTAAYAPVRRASGGAVWGAGTATSDSIPALLSNGEYVLRAAAARTLGLGTLNKLNHADKMTDPALLDRMAVGNTPAAASGPVIGSIVVNNPSSNVDVERAVLRGMARAERIKKERG